MGRLIFIWAFLLIATTTSAQDNHLYANGKRVYTANVLLKKSEMKRLFFGTPAYETYKDALHQRTAGSILLGTGIATMSCGTFVTMLTGLFYIMGESDGPRESYWRNGGDAYLGVILAGVGMTTGGVILLCAGKKSVARAVDIYNSTRSRPSSGELSLGFTSSGIGLAYRF